MSMGGGGEVCCGGVGGERGRQRRGRAGPLLSTAAAETVMQSQSREDRAGEDQAVQHRRHSRHGGWRLSVRASRCARPHTLLRPASPRPPLASAIAEFFCAGDGATLTSANAGVRTSRLVADLGMTRSRRPRPSFHRGPVERRPVRVSTNVSDVRACLCAAQATAPRLWWTQRCSTTPCPRWSTRPLSTADRPPMRSYTKTGSWWSKSR